MEENNRTGNRDVVFLTLGIAIWLSQDEIITLVLYAYIGISVGVGLGLYTAPFKEKKSQG